jgi:NAD(P)-dependent dehydrogenase (short-subunit alcohol dehydrogenase family)
MAGRLENKVVFVTGASRGIGAAIARLAAREGAKLFLFSRNEEAGHSVAESIGADGGKATFNSLDITDGEAVRGTLRKIIDREGRVDVLINCAGAHAGSAFQDEADETWGRMHEVNVMGTVYPSKAVVPKMIEQRFGSIVNISSKAGVVGEPGHAAYSASKGAVIALTRAMAVDLSPLGIRVNSVAPGPVNTEMFHTALPDPEARAALAEATPIKRVGEVEDVAHLAIYFASDESGWCTGQTFSLDGGLSILK